MSQYYSTGPTRRRGRVTAFGVIAVLVALIAGGAGGYYLYGHQSVLTKLATLRGGKTNSPTTVPGQVVPALVNGKDTKDIGAKDPGDPLSLTFSLPLNNEPTLELLLKQQNDPNSQFYHKYLTPEQFNKNFSPSAADKQLVADFLTLAGLKVSSTSASDYVINAQASVATIESAFHIQLHQYSDSADGKIYYGPTSDPIVSSAVGGLIKHIGGLDNYSHAIPPPGLDPKASSAGGYIPTQLQKAYGADSLISQGIDGSGQSIAFVELADYNSSDISTYQQQNNITGGTVQKLGSGASLGQGSIEVELDMEVAFAMAPKINELIYEGPNTGQGINDLYSQIVNDDKAKIVSISWGLCEQDTGTAELQALDQIFQQGAAEGMSFFAAAGDNGAYDCGNGTVGVDSPADDPYVTGVGGTSLTQNADGSYGETAWYCDTAKCQQQNPKGEGGGGGVSAAFPIPDFQNGLSPSGAKGNGRFVPDVAADADPQTGYAIYCTVRPSCSGSGNIEVGGTSGAAPLWAGTAALISESLQQSNSTLGNANAALYAASKTSGALNDITQSQNPLLPAGPGYDLATGLGSPNTTTLAQALASVASGGGTGTGSGTPTPTPIGGTTPTPGGTATPQPPGTTGQNLIDNGSFENGTNPWVESSSGGYELIDTELPHSGRYNADLCGYTACDDIIGQAFTVPSDTSNLTLSYYWYMVTTENGSHCVDDFTVSLVTINNDGTPGNTIKTAQQSCNSNANNHYQLKTVDVSSALSSYAGQDVALIFEMKGGGSNSTRVEVDDIALG